MKCEYSDGLKVDYSGSLRITKGSDVNVFMQEGAIPVDIRRQLESASHHSKCQEVRTIAQTVQNRVGNRACIHK